MDYRYFPDPDLLPLQISREWIERVGREMPELPGAMRERFKREYELPEYDASLLTSSLAMSQYFESTLNALAQQQDAAHANWSSDAANGKIVANWIVNEIAALLNRDSIEIEECPIPPRALAEVVCLVLAGTLPRKNAKELLQEAWGEARSAGRRWQRLSLEIEPARLTIAGRTIDLIIEARGLKQISDAGAIEKLIDEVLAANPGPVSEFRAGKEKAFNSLVGQAMKATKGKANPQQVNEILRRKLAS
jgi:aspartyl-tRNA(Asn)/glutamyl-tRNA(Gln) amidotransferase subunit B